MTAEPDPTTVENKQRCTEFLRQLMDLIASDDVEVTSFNGDWMNEVQVTGKTENGFLYHALSGRSHAGFQVHVHDRAQESKMFAELYEYGALK